MLAIDASKVEESVYRTDLGACYNADSLVLLAGQPEASVDLIVTSPPYALASPKSYGNKTELEYVEWFMPFAKQFRRVLKSTGSLVIDLGGAWVPSKPFKSLYQYRLLLALCDSGFDLAQDFFWHNSAKLPSPATLVNIKRIRVKDAVNTIWWLVKSEHATANNRNILEPYKPGMKRLLETGSYNRGLRPSGHSMVGDTFVADNGGAIPSNLIQASNTNSTDPYLDLCRNYGLRPHPARFPRAVPELFVKFLTSEGDLVMDPFAGSNLTGRIAEDLGRRWLAIELNETFWRGSQLRFLRP